MAFLETDTHGQERFSLLLLEPGEVYFEEFSVYYYLPGLAEHEAIKRKQKGYLKMCSKSIVFVPNDIPFPILRFPMKYVKELTEWTGSLFSRMDTHGRVIRINSEQHIEMKERNIVAPYIFKRVETEHLFSLNYASLDDCLPQLCQLHRASTLPPADQSAMINAIVLSRQSRVKFNTSWMEDLYEKILLETQANRITPLATNPGRVMLTSGRLYFQPFNNIEKWPVLKIRLKNIKRVIRRRFLLRQLGLEFYCSDNAPVSHLYLQVQDEESRDKLYFYMMEQPELKLEDTRQEDVALKWQSGHISNYEYLMYLNSMADRSHNDLTQYPVLPWVVSDYTSSTLDLEDEKTFRDLSKPVGALDAERLARFKERMADMPEPKFLYGSHYSTPGYVLFYLARIAPEYVLCLQNGKFDHPDRMFNNVQETWSNCLTGASDFKELIPEFYEGHGEFLQHKKLINFGMRQDGRPVEDVELPPWATSPQHFIECLRQALESDYVSRNIHHWIDLIFGFKQRGPEAEKADNLFYYLTYEGAIDLDSIKDPNERKSMETQLMEFGQTPKQLFTTPHPQRFCSKKVPRPLSQTDPTPTPRADNLDGPAAAVEGRLEEVTSDPSSVWDNADFSKLSVYTEHILHKDAVSAVQLMHDGKNIISVSFDSMLKMYSLEDQRQLRSVSMSSMALSSCQVMPDNKTVICGSWDNSVYFYSIEFGKVLHTLQHHDDAVSSVLWVDNKLFTASWDSTVKILDCVFDKTKSGIACPELVFQFDHDSGVTCQALDGQCSVLATGNKEGQLTLWDLNTFDHSVQVPAHLGRVNSVLLSKDGRRLVSCGEDRYIKVVDSASGLELFTKDLTQELLCLCWAGRWAVAGSVSGQLQVWDMDRGQLQQELSAHNDAVTCLHVQEGGTMLTGGKDRRVIMWKPSLV